MRASNNCIDVHYIDWIVCRKTNFYIAECGFSGVHQQVGAAYKCDVCRYYMTWRLWCDATQYTRLTSFLFSREL